MIEEGQKTLEGMDKNKNEMRNFYNIRTALRSQAPDRILINEINYFAFCETPTHLTP